MNRKFFIFSFFYHHPQLNSYIIIIFFSFLTRITFCSSQNPGFVVCHPQTCGNNQNISYPFYIRGKQEPYCGYPGFELLCSNNGFPILNLSNTHYIIQEISYESRSLRVLHPAFSASNSIKCLPPPNNLTLEENKFQFARNQKDMFLIYGCDTETVSLGLQEHEVRCTEANETGSVVALYKDDRNLNYALDSCGGEVVAATVEEEREDIGEALRRGFWLNWTAADCSECNRSGGKCGFDYGLYTFQCYCSDRAHFKQCTTPPPAPAPLPPEKSGRVLRLGLGLGIWINLNFIFLWTKRSETPSTGLGIGVFVTLVIGILIIWICKRRYASSKVQFHSRDSSYSNPDPETGGVYFGIPVFSYKELEEATNNFESTRELGDGGFGTVYYGKLQDGREVAVKRLYEHNYRRVEQFMNEVKILTRLRHRNLVSLYGCTSHQSRDLLLVYEYIPNGTIASHLHGDLAKPGLLPWAVRMKIAIETATALAYLHATDIIHRDVKTNNILLDNSYCVKVADFGLSRLFPNDVTHVSTAPQGTPGYVDPEYHQCYQLTSKSDVYSFGVVLIELISSMPAVDMSRHSDEINLSNLAVKKIQKSAFSELVDPYLGFESDNEVKRMIISVAELAFQCLQRERELRPSMDEVLEALKRIERGEDEPEQPEEADVRGAGISHSNTVQTPPPASPDWNDVGLLKNMKLPPSPKSVSGKWESHSTTPSVSGGSLCLVSFFTM